MPIYGLCIGISSRLRGCPPEATLTVRGSLANARMGAVNRLPLVPTVHDAISVVRSTVPSIGWLVPEIAS
jgi:hypothetical protein